MTIEKGTQHWDGTKSLAFCLDDGGRAAAGFKGSAGDCVVRAVAIASGRPYAEVYTALAKGQGEQRKSKGATPRNGVNTSREWFKRYMRSLGFEWIPCMRIGEGCSVHLLEGELPKTGRLVVRVSKHYTAVIDGVIRDSHNPTRATMSTENGVQTMTHRCVYGYWRMS